MPTSINQQSPLAASPTLTRIDLSKYKTRRPPFDRFFLQINVVILPLPPSIERRPQLILDDNRNLSNQTVECSVSSFDHTKPSPSTKSHLSSNHPFANLRSRTHQLQPPDWIYLDSPNTPSNFVISVV